jgi:AraC-like DNA-binding protein
VYREFRPPAAPGLACLWVQEVEPGDPPTRILPDACSDLVWIRQRGVHLAGPDTTAAVATLPAGAWIVGARLGPGAGGPALGRSLEDLRDQRLELPGLIDPELEPAEALQQLARHAVRLVAAQPPDLAVHEAARRLAADPRRRTSALADELGLSERQLRRRCRAGVGYGPKTLQRVLRLRRFLDGLDGDDDLAALAFDAGYADQAHLTREARRLTGLTPAALLRERA